MTAHEQDGKQAQRLSWLPSRLWQRILFGGVALGLLVALVAGWWEFWFLTDDAHITFRYISNHRLGWGYTWNPPPFKPVEGYSNFLWMVLLDYVWRITGIDPTRSANTASLIFATGTLVIAFSATVQLRLPSRWQAVRPWLGLAVCAGLVANRTFLTWTSSGLETALFVFCSAAWLLGALNVARGAGPRWMGATAAAATAAMLTRPDGALFVLTTLAFFAVRASSAQRATQPLRPWIVAMSPLAAIGLHLLWRRWFYGEWAPNTYYAKFVAPWPEAGIRYTLSFAFEFCLFAWALPGLWLLGRLVIRLEKNGLAPHRIVPQLPRWLVAAPFIVHVLYYALIIGGDHFEYRIYAHLLLPMLLMLVVWCASLHERVFVGLGVFALVIGLQQPVAWTHYAKTRTLNTRGETFKLTVPIAPLFPAGPLREYVRSFDILQGWLQARHVGTRHQEHKVFFLTTMKDFPPREEGAEIAWEPGHPVFWGACVGGSSWRLPRTAVIDVLGLNDYVVARNPVRSLPEVRLMAHERSAPPGYLDCFRPNVSVANGKATVNPRPVPLTDQDIEACETRFRADLK